MRMIVVAAVACAVGFALGAAPALHATSSAPNASCTSATYTLVLARTTTESRASTIRARARHYGFVQAKVKRVGAKWQVGVYGYPSLTAVKSALHEANTVPYLKALHPFYVRVG